MARIDIPDGPGGDPAMVWSLRPEMAGMVDRMITTVYQRSVLPAAEREVARMRVAQLNACGACTTFRAAEYPTYGGYTERQRLAIEYAERFVIDHRAIDEELFGRLRREFSDAEVLDLTLCLAVYLGSAVRWRCSGSTRAPRSRCEPSDSEPLEPRARGDTARRGRRPRLALGRALPVKGSSGPWCRGVRISRPAP